MTDTMGTNTEIGPLPAGVHPMDPSTAQDMTAAPADTPGSRYDTGAPPYKVSNDGAIAVFQRGSHDWTVQIVVVDANSSGTAQAVGRQKGRQSVTLTVPTTLPDGTTPNGVTFAPDRDALESGINAAGVLNQGDSVTINTEASVYVGLIGANATGACQVVVEFNPPGGAYGVD